MQHVNLCFRSESKMKMALNLVLSLTPEKSLPLLVDWFQSVCQKNPSNDSYLCRSVITSLQDVTSHITDLNVQDKLTALTQDTQSGMQNISPI